MCGNKKASFFLSRRKAQHIKVLERGFKGENLFQKIFSLVYLENLVVCDLSFVALDLTIYGCLRTPIDGKLF